MTEEITNAEVHELANTLSERGLLVNYSAWTPDTDGPTRWEFYESDTAEGTTFWPNSEQARAFLIGMLRLDDGREPSKVEPATAAIAHVLRVDYVEIEPGFQGSGGVGYYLPACSCSWVSPVGVDPNSYGHVEGARREAWRLAHVHAVTPRGAVLHDVEAIPE